MMFVVVDVSIPDKKILSVAVISMYWFSQDLYAVLMIMVISGLVMGICVVEVLLILITVILFAVEKHCNTIIVADYVVEMWQSHH